MASKSVINTFLMEYFLIEGCADVVQEFTRESFASPSTSSSNSSAIDSCLLSTLSSRDIIQQHISQGLILESISLIEQSFPTLLHDPQLLFQLYEQHFIELILSSNLIQALQFASEKILPLIFSESTLRPKMEEMMCLVLFLNSQQESAIPPKYLSKFHLDKRYELARSINLLILQSSGYQREAKFVKVLKEMICQQENLLKRKANVAFPQPEIEL